MGGGKTVDRVRLDTRFLGEVEETADVVVLFEAGKEAFRLFDRKTKLGNGNGITEGMDQLAVAIREFL